MLHVVGFVVVKYYTPSSTAKDGMPDTRLRCSLILHDYLCYHAGYTSRWEWRLAMLRDDIPVRCAVLRWAYADTVDTDVRSMCYLLVTRAGWSYGRCVFASVPLSSVDVRLNGDTIYGHRAQYDIPYVLRYFLWSWLSLTFTPTYGRYYKHPSPSKEVRYYSKGSLLCIFTYGMEIPNYRLWRLHIG